MKYNTARGNPVLVFEFEFLKNLLRAIQHLWEPMSVFLKVFLRKMERNSERVDGGDSTGLFASKPKQAAAAAL